jgi:oxygen-independent coproporphyrinogen-3 oxidase
MQSASPEELKILDRDHKYESVVNAVKWSKLAGFSHINLDLIFGIPGQTRESWQRTLNLALGFDIDHFSIYSLIVEEGTRLKHWIDRGLLVAPEDDLGAYLYEDTMDFLDLAHYQQYEISNWSRGEGSVCRHNMQYWRFLPYLGFGAGAHGFFDHTRTENQPLIKDYIQSVRNGRVSSFPIGPATLEPTRLTEWELIQENLMVSMRLTLEGINLSGFQDLYQISLMDLFPKQIDRLMQTGLIEYFNDWQNLRLTRKGRLFGNRVFSEFIGNNVPQGFEYLDH